MVLNQIVKEQLNIRTEARVRAIRRRCHKAVHPHRAVVPSVQVEFVACNSDGCNDLAGFGDGPYATVAAEPWECQY